MAAILRGTVRIDGDVAVIVRLRRLLARTAPTPPLVAGNRSQR